MNAHVCYRCYLLFSIYYIKQIPNSHTFSVKLNELFYYGIIVVIFWEFHIIIYILYRAWTALYIFVNNVIWLFIYLIVGFICLGIWSLFIIIYFWIPLFLHYAVFHIYSLLFSDYQKNVLIICTYLTRKLNR